MSITPRNECDLLSSSCRQKHTISQRSIDVDKAVPQHMGISKAILENVIFVHQEDANWPLKESKILVRHRARVHTTCRERHAGIACARWSGCILQKEKFDDIFSATRYSKALDAIKKLRKEKMVRATHFAGAREDGA